MKTCKDCYHFDACVNELGTTKFYKNVIAANNVEKMCPTFKDKSLVLDLPCNVWDILFYFDEFYKKIKEYRVTGIDIVVSCKSLRGSRHSFSLSSFGKTVFLTRDAAEQALKGGAE